MMRGEFVVVDMTFPEKLINSSDVSISVSRTDQHFSDIVQKENVRMKNQKLFLFFHSLYIFHTY